MKPRPPSCPFLVPVTGNQLWPDATGVSCKPPGRGSRTPARATLVRLCLGPAYVRCAGYREGIRAAVREVRAS